MTRIIDLENVTEVLLPDGTWNKVHNGTFKVDGYLNAEEGEYIRGKGISAKHGATWVDAETKERVVCPIGSIAGVKYIRRKDDIYED